MKLATVFLIGQIIRLIPSFAYPLLAAIKDFIQIESNGKFDSLKERFHAVNVWIRVLVFVSIGLAVDVPIIILSGAYIKGAVAFVSYELLTACLFWNLFDERLNSLRNLPKGYVGQNAWIDQYMIKIAIRFFGSDLEKAGRYLKRGSVLISAPLYLAICALILAELYNKV